jgi:uncharacterized protein YjiS (DUF1127 family)
MIMSTTLGRPAVAGGRIRGGGGPIATIKMLWTAYLRRRIERAAIIQLHAMSDRELRDIGLDRSQIEWAVRGDLDTDR